MKLTVFGRTGQVATELRRLAGPGLELEIMGRDAADFSDPAGVARAARAATGDAFVNAVAYTAVDAAETDEPAASVVNGVSVGALADAAARSGRPLIHLSTDYVFDGSGEAAWRPDDATSPINAYGRSKRAGEMAVLAAGGPHAVIRTSWVFSAHGRNFVTTMLRLGRERSALSIVADQIGGPTSAERIAAMAVETAAQIVADPGKSGVYHFAGAGDVSWADFARTIFRQAGLGVAVTDIPTADYPTPARRPQNSRLDCTSLRDTFGIGRPDWREDLARVLAELGATS